MSFTLRISNPPYGAVWWIPDFAENTFNYDPPAASGALTVDQAWEYPSDPRGCVTLHIMVFDAPHNVLLNVYNLGPVNDGKDYEYDCSARVLYELVPEEFAGTITRKELEYDGIHNQIPVY